MISGAFYASLAGFLGAVASSSAKLSLGSDYLKGMCKTGLKAWAQDGDYKIIQEETSPCDWALRHSSSSARATVTTTASNFVSSAFVGKLIFGETHAALWWVGISLTLSGLLVLHRSTSRPAEAKKEE
ncbi:transmembrane protein 42 [Coregonus clupeaformis]|uniref:transmembrane protein 42 n=1 Tax=Coregonus clupeaformis TaxID=59861 RepID=UPI001BE03C01|nr:transmembrane protein 42 [Coregonus clupeaformis]